MLSAGDSQRVAELMRETAATELLPRFRNLAAGDVRSREDDGEVARFRVALDAAAIAQFERRLAR